jgi:hypothetical protein
VAHQIEGSKRARKDGMKGDVMKGDVDVMKGDVDQNYHIFKKINRRK